MARDPLLYALNMRTSLILLFSTLAFGQAPQITPGGVVSAASWSSPIAPGELIAIFGMNLGETNVGTASGGTSVTINGITAPVIFVSPTQINAQVPASLPTDDPNLVAASVVVTTAGLSLTRFGGSLFVSKPGSFLASAEATGLVTVQVTQRAVTNSFV
jgi:uncharacterized protein (TIGR03437 family)